MKKAAYCLSETPLGGSGIAWKGPGTRSPGSVVSFIQLPEAERSLTKRRLAGQNFAFPMPTKTANYSPSRKYLR
jgi:hypothetical protein